MNTKERLVCPTVSITANGISMQYAQVEALEKKCLAKYLVDAYSLLIDAGKFVKEKHNTTKQGNKQ
jgi:hypothetical protein